LLTPTITVITKILLNKPCFYYAFNAVNSILLVDGFYFKLRKNTLDTHHFLPDFEKGTKEYILNQKGKIFIDIGAHIGKYSILASKKFQEVVAIEAHPKTYVALTENIKINKIRNVVSVHAAAYFKDAIISLFENPINFGESSIVFRESMQSYHTCLISG